MRNQISLLTCLVLFIFLLGYRTIYRNDPLKVTTWDALGYYQYLPAVFIYNDVEKMSWFERADSLYGLSGGHIYQLHQLENGNRVSKYFGGVAVLQLPFFLAAHCYALTSDYQADGFSAPYQYAIAYGALIYVFLALLLLRHLLLRYFSDGITALTIFLMVVATNFPRYAAVDNGMSHAFIFPLYALIIYATIKWHENPSRGRAMLIGAIMGLAVICRPTEAIILFIPLLWNTHTKAVAAAKWQLVKEHRKHLFWAALAGLIAISPQLIYWQIVTSTPVYNVGSKWYFLTPYFRVLFGFENGSFIYTPVTILFVAGLFLMRRFPFGKSILVFSLLNIWIVMAWSDWQYGATFATRALVQSYAVLVFPMAAAIRFILKSKFQILFILILTFLTALNLFQLDQYDKTILHYRDMNRHYYARIFLDADPTPLDMSVLDSNEVVAEMAPYEPVPEVVDSNMQVVFSAPDSFLILDTVLHLMTGSGEHRAWFDIRAEILSKMGFFHSYLYTNFSWSDGSNDGRVRLFSPISGENSFNDYRLQVVVPPGKEKIHLKAYITSKVHYDGVVRRIRIGYLEQDLN